MKSGVYPVTHFQNASEQQLRSLVAELEASYRSLKAEQLNLDITRGKPAADQVGIASKLDGILE